LKHSEVLERCAVMDSLSGAERVEALAFGKAMTALEGLPTSNETKNNLLSWERGELSFKDSYLQTLEKYGLVEA